MQRHLRSKPGEHQQAISDKNQEQAWKGKMSRKSAYIISSEDLGEVLNKITSVITGRKKWQLY
jgi:hypothetical protein